VSTPVTGALSPYRILDLTTSRSWLTGKLLADLGADVIKVEPPGGDPGRWQGPFADGVASPEHSLPWWALNRGKRSVIADPATAGGRDLILRLAASADAVLESYQPGQLEYWGLGLAELAAVNPGIVLTRVTAFGQAGPYARYRANDLILSAIGGQAWMTGDEDRPPVRITVPQSFNHAAAEAAVHTTAALYHAARSGRGQQVDVSAQLTVVRTLMNAMAGPHTDGSVACRSTFGRPTAGSPYQSLYPCADGHVIASVGFGPGVEGYLRWLLEESGSLPPTLAAALGEGIAPDYAANHPAFADQVSAALAGFFAPRTKEQLTDQALAHRLMLVPINTAADLYADVQLAAREYFTTVEHEGRKPVRYPSAWVHLTATPLAETPRAPRIGEHDPELRESLAAGKATRAQRRQAGAAVPAAAAAGGPVFDGVRVWDASWVGVGPLTTKYLADYGATVIRSESARNPDVLRLAPPFRDGVRGINRSQFFADFNSSKRGLGVDLAHERGREIALRLARWADVVVESFSPGVMARLGLSYEQLQAVNPSLIMLSTSMNGQTGPRRTFAGFGTVMAPMAGFSEVTGWPDRLPGSPFGAYTDFICQRLCGTVLIAALDHKRRTGEGQYIDLAQYEGGLQFQAAALLDYAVNGRAVSRDGNRSPDAAPHGIYPCRPDGDRDRWIAIAVERDDDWPVLAGLIGSPGWAADPALRTLEGRKAAEDLIDRELAAWTAQRDRDEVFRRLQPRIAAAPVNDPADLHRDPQLEYRRYLRELRHPEMGPTLYEGPQAELSLTPPRLAKAAPCLGEDTRWALAEIGYDAVAIDELLQVGAAQQYAPPPAGPPEG
jgi:crotonobetainyl-CoA:carnitine CoA-transferase CaiB-like acyl-CoA transferase